MNEDEIGKKLEVLSAIKSEIGKIIVGQENVVNELMIGLLAGGHCLLEGVPGLAKTLLVSTLAKTMALDFHRVQFTPDLMPSDILGTEILEEDHATGKRFFKFQKGPIFTNIFLADEINRTPPKTQAALLEAMQEKHISYGGATYPLPSPFFVLATQNPVEQSGTYPLPEAQLDRFLMFIKVGYPSAKEEVEVLKRTTTNNNTTLSALIDDSELLSLQTLVRDIEVSDSVVEYAAQMVRLSRPETTTSEQLKDYIRWGAGPRAGQALILCAKATALLNGRFSVEIDDIINIAHSVLRHRILLNFQAEADQINIGQIIKILVQSTPLPKSKLA